MTCFLFWEIFLYGLMCKPSRSMYHMDVLILKWFRIWYKTIYYDMYQFLYYCKHHKLFQEQIFVFNVLFDSIYPWVLWGFQILNPYHLLYLWMFYILSTAYPRIHILLSIKILVFHRRHNPCTVSHQSSPQSCRSHQWNSRDYISMIYLRTFLHL